MMVSNKVCKNGDGDVGLLPATDDDHQGVIVDMKEAMDAKVFATRLRASVSTWRQQVVVSYWNTFIINQLCCITLMNAVKVCFNCLLGLLFAYLIL
jgi:hypothetical protein